MHDHNQSDALDQPKSRDFDRLDEENKLAEERAKEIEDQYIKESLPSGFGFDSEGWLTFQEINSKDGTPGVPTKVCSHLQVVARTRDQANENHGRLLQFPDPDGFTHKWAMPMALLAGDGAEFRQELLSRGLLIAPGGKARQHLMMYVQTAHPPKTVRCASQTGWNHNQTAFVLHDRTLGRDGPEDLILQSTSMLSSVSMVAGTLDGWQQMASLCLENPKLIFAVSAAFAPPLIRLLGAENGGFLFRGRSGTGKTTCLKVANSVWGPLELVQQLRATANGLEGIAAAYNDSLLCLDELGQIDPQELGKAIYMLANGFGKGRSDKSGNPRKRSSWRVMCLLSGELSVADCMKEANQKIRAGQEVRILDIPADNETHGCFYYLHEHASAKQFADKILELSKHNHGVAGREFLKRLLSEQLAVVKQCRDMINELSLRYVAQGVDTQVNRAFHHFALVAAAGEVASSLGITGWEVGIAREAAIRCFNDWISSRGHSGPQEEQEVLSMVGQFFALHGESRFAPWEPTHVPSKTTLRTGFRKATENGDEFYVFPVVFKKDICAGYDPAFVAKVCIKHGWLMPDKNGSTSTRPERLPGSKGTTRVYRFTPFVLGVELPPRSATSCNTSHFSDETDFSWESQLSQLSHEENLTFGVQSNERD